MSKFAATISLWESQLKESDKEAEDCIQSIKKYITDEGNPVNKCKIALKVLCTVCTLVQGQFTGATNFNNIIFEISKYVIDDYLHAYISRIHYYFARLVSEKLFDEATFIIPLLAVKKTDDEKVIRIYYEIHKSVLPSLIAVAKLEDNKTEACFKNLIEVFKISNTNLFVELLNDTFKLPNNLSILIQNSGIHGVAFLENIVKIVENIDNYDNFQFLYLTITKLLANVVQIEFNIGQKYDISQSLIKTILSEKNRQENLNYYKIAAMLYHLLKLIGTTDLNEFNNSFNTLIKKTIETLDVQNVKEVWLMDAAVIIIEILMITSKNIIAQLNENNFKLSFDFLKHITKILPNINYENSFCRLCSSLKRHEIANVGRVISHFYRRVVELNLQDISIQNTYSSIIKYTITIFTDFKCSIADKLLENLCISCLTIVDKIQDESFAATGIAILNLLRNVKRDYGILKSEYVLQLYHKMYYKLKKYKKALVMSAISAVYLFKNSSKETTLNELYRCCKLYEEAGQNFQLTVCDIVDNADDHNFEIPIYDRRKLILLQLEACIQYKLNDELKKSLSEKAIENSVSEIEFANTISKLGNLINPNLQTKITNAIGVLNKYHNPESSICLALGQLYYCLFLIKIDTLKECFKNDEKFSDSDLETIDCNKFKNITINVENNLLDICLKSIKFFSKYFKLITKNNIEELESNSSYIQDSVAYLARQLELRNYIEHAYLAWNLLYDIAKQTETSLNKLRAVSFMAFHSQIIEQFDQKNKIKEYILEIADKLNVSYENIRTETPRKKNNIFLCMLNIALYYSRNGEIEKSFVLSNMVYEKYTELKTEENCCGIVKICLYYFQYQIMTKVFKDFPYSPYTFALHIFEEIRSIKYLTSEDSLNIPTILLYIMTEITYYNINRITSTPARPILYMILKFAVLYGMTLRTAQILSLLAFIDLQMEKSSLCESKLILLDVILKVEQFESNENYIPIPKTKPNYQQLLVPYEPVSRSANRTTRRALSPKNIKLPETVPKNKIARYLINHEVSCNCDICKNTMYQMVFFEVGCLQARKYYIDKKFRTCEILYKDIYEWWTKYEKTHLKITFQHASLWMLNYYINIARRLQKYTLSLELCDITYKFYAKYAHMLDCAFEEIIFEQNASTEFRIKHPLGKPYGEIEQYSEGYSSVKIDLMELYEDSVPYVIAGNTQYNNYIAHKELHDMNSCEDISTKSPIVLLDNDEDPELILKSTTACKTDKGAIPKKNSKENLNIIQKMNKDTILSNNDGQINSQDHKSVKLSSISSGETNMNTKHANYKSIKRPERKHNAISKKVNQTSVIDVDVIPGITIAQDNTKSHEDISTKSPIVISDDDTELILHSNTADKGAIPKKDLKENLKIIHNKMNKDTIINKNDGQINSEEQKSIKLGSINIKKNTKLVNNKSSMLSSIQRPGRKPNVISEKNHQRNGIDGDIDKLTSKLEVECNITKKKNLKGTMSETIDDKDIDCIEIANNRYKPLIKVKEKNTKKNKLTTSETAKSKKSNNKEIDLFNPQYKEEYLTKDNLIKESKTEVPYSEHIVNGNSNLGSKEQQNILKENKENTTAYKKTRRIKLRTKNDEPPLQETVPVAARSKRRKT